MADLLGQGSHSFTPGMTKHKKGGHEEAERGISTYYEFDLGR